MEAKLYGQNKGGMSINGIIKDYYAYAGENISAGDLVEYVNGIAGKVDYGESVDTQLSMEAQSGANISAVALDENRVFIAHGGIDGVNKLGAMVCTIDGATITCGTDTTLSTAAGSGREMSVAKLNENKVFIAHANSSSESDKLRGMVCIIDEMSILPGESIALGSGYSSNSVSTVTLDENRVFVTYCNGSNYYLYAGVCTIDGTTITAGTSTALVSSTNAGYVISTCLLQNGNVFIAHSYGSSYYLYGMVCSISGTTITAGSDTQLSSATYTAYDKISTVSLPNGNVFIAHGREKSYYYLYGMVCQISGTTITAGADTNLGASKYGARVISAVLLPNGNVFVAHSYDGNYYHAGIVCAISGTNITSGTWVKFSEGSDMYMGYAISAVLLSNGAIFIAHSNSTNYYLNAQIFAVDKNNIPTNNIVITEYETQVRQVTTGQFDGIAKTSGKGAPEFVEAEVVKEGNVFPTTWNVETKGTKYSSDDGYVLEASSVASASGSMIASAACDATKSTLWQSADGSSHWLKMTCPMPTKITKMNMRVASNNDSYIPATVIQGSINGEDWVDLYSVTEQQDEMKEIELNNTSFYTDYQIVVNLTSSSYRANVYEWQTSEYIVKEQIPSTEHNEQVSIWTKE